MQICMLVQVQHRPIPETCEVLQDYGPETIVDISNGKACSRGYVMILEGEVSAFIAWLGSHGAIWRCSSPIIGDWQLTKLVQLL